jgi:pyrimidine operon attenuation protein/uracil phosphoribosyltransferase
METHLQRIVMESAEILETLTRMANDIVRQASRNHRLVLIGIHTGGVHLARRLQAVIERNHQLSLPVGTLDINLYRDDWTLLHTQPLVRSTDLPFRIDDQEVILVDDVLFTGRTIRAALDALIDYGRPRRVQVAVLVDRGHRELPICAQFIGVELDTAQAEQVNVHLEETDGYDRVTIETPPHL